MLQTRNSYAQSSYATGEPRVEGLTREEVTRHYQRKILLIARQIVDRLPPSVSMEFEDLVSYGAIGLLEAFDRFDEARGIQFSTFAEYRIRGAMLDELRTMDWVPRLVRSRSTKVDRARKSIEMETGIKATQDQIQDFLEID